MVTSYGISLILLVWHKSQGNCCISFINFSFTLNSTNYLLSRWWRILPEARTSRLGSSRFTCLSRRFLLFLTSTSYIISHLLTILLRVSLPNFYDYPLLLTTPQYSKPSNNRHNVPTTPKSRLMVDQRTRHLHLSQNRSCNTSCLYCQDTLGLLQYRQGTGRGSEGGSPAQPELQLLCHWASLTYTSIIPG